MTRATLNRAAAVMPLAFSALAFADVIANIVAGVPPTADEGAAAHLWQLLMGAQLPLIMLFAATANWRSSHAAAVLGTQFLAFALACAPVYWAGY